MEKIKLIKPSFSYSDIESDFKNIFGSGIFSNGPYCKKFSCALSEFTGASHAYLTSSCTTALWMCLKLLGVGPGDEVPVSDFSFPASANVIEDLGARPIFVDVCKDTFNMCPKELEAKFSSRTKAVMFVDSFGNPSNLLEVKAQCAERNIPLIEDAACAIGSSIEGVRCGQIADLTCFSFHPRKLINCGEGGAILTNNNKWAESLEVQLQHGSVAADFRREFVALGYNFRLSELQAALGLRQLQELDALTAERNKICSSYNSALAPLGFILQHVAPHAFSNRQSIVFIVPKNVDRNGMIQHLRHCGIESSIGTYSLSGTQYNINKYGFPNRVSIFLQDNTLTLPCYKSINTDKVIEAVMRMPTTSPTNSSKHQHY